MLFQTLKLLGTLARKKGVPVTYTVGKESLETYDGIPILALSEILPTTSR